MMMTWMLDPRCSKSLQASSVWHVLESQVATEASWTLHEGSLGSTQMDEVNGVVTAQLCTGRAFVAS